MLLILEIILTIVAWRRGWKWRALLPSAIILGFSFALGLIIGIAAGPDADAPVVLETLIDVVDIAVLCILIAKPPRARELAQPSVPPL